jgi:hypothetical protein
MITMTIHPRSGENIYKLLINRELELRRKNKGAFVRRSGKARRRRDIWVHKKHSGQILFAHGVGGTLSATIHSRKENDDWQILSAFIGFLRRDFSGQILNITVTFVE